MGRDQLLESIELGLFLLPEMPGVIDKLPFEGVHARVTRVSHPLANIVGAARLSRSEVPPTVRRVTALFADAGRSFSWRVGPSTRPKDLGRELRKSGLTRGPSLSAMTLTNLTRAPNLGKITVRQAVPGDAAVVEDLIANGYPVPAALARVLSRAFLQDARAANPTVRAYLASESEREPPVAIGTMFRFADRPVVMLGGAATLPGYRGRGIYAALVEHRLRQASRCGARAAVIQAVRDTSAPVCRKLGFVEVGDIETFVWRCDEAG